MSITDFTLWLETFVQSFGVLAPLIFGLVYFVALLFMIPATAFTILAGVLFGQKWGTFIVVIAASFSALAAFFIARFLGKDILKKIPEKNGVAKLIKKIEGQVEKNGFRTFFIMRCLFLPYIAMSYAAGLVPKAKARDFFWATLITNMIVSPAFVFLGDSLLKGPKALLLPVGLIALVFLIPKVTKYLSSR